VEVRGVVRGGATVQVWCCGGAGWPGEVKKQPVRSCKYNKALAQPRY